MAPMRIGLNRKPGQSGTKKLLARYGDRLICVRYRYDEERKKRFKTIELIIEETEWTPKRKAFKDGDIVGVKIGIEEKELQSKVKRAGASGIERRRSGKYVSTVPQNWG